MNRLLAFTRILALALFLGGGAAIALIVAPATFRILETDRAAAGAVVGRSLGIFEWVALASTAAGFVASLALRVRRAPSLVADLALASLLAGSVYVHFLLAPAIRDARPAGTGAGTEFMRLHKRYEQVFGFELLLALAALYAATSPGNTAPAASK